MDSDDRLPDGDEAGFESPGGDDILDRLISDEMGEEIAAVMRRARRAQETWHRRSHPDEGLRERKRRLTRQLISDAATTLFATRGFDNVKVSEVADRVGVSEKTIYNYFPTKESMVLDTADEAVERMAKALRERGPGVSLTEAVVEAIKADTARFDQAPDELVEFMPLFAAMLESTPALRAAWLEMLDRLAKVARDELAAQAGVDPRDPEPTAAGRALAGLGEVGMESRMRHIRDGLRGAELNGAVTGDLDRAANLLETGLWSFNLPRSQRAQKQAAEAARSAEEARAQVLKALRQARAAWNEVRGGGRGGPANAHRSPPEAAGAIRDARRHAQESVREARRQAQEAAREAQRHVREAHRDAQRQLREAQQEELEAIREAQRQAHEAPRTPGQ
jgi:AcrR family transcriptional regulator